MATQSSLVSVRPGLPATEMYLSVIVAPDEDDLAHGGPHGARVSHVMWEVVTQATSNDPIHITHIIASDSLVNDTIHLRYDTIPGGDLTGMVVRVRCEFYDMASGGI